MLSSKNSISKKIKRKLRLRFKLMHIGALIFYFILGGIWVFVFCKLFKAGSILLDDFFYQRIAILIIIIAIFYLIKKFVTYITSSIRDNFIIEIDTDDNSEFKIVSIAGEKYNVSNQESIIIARRWDYVSSFFIYKTWITWGKGQEEIFQVIVNERKFYLMPNLFEDIDGVYTFLKKIK